MEKVCRNCALKTSPRSLFNFIKYPKTVNACKKLFKIFRKRYFERDYLETFEKLT